VACTGYAFQIELTYRAVRRGFRVVEVPIVFADRRVGQSKMSKRIVLEALRKVWAIRFSGWAKAPAPSLPAADFRPQESPTSRDDYGPRPEA